MNGESGSRFEHPPGVLDFARSLVSEYDEHQKEQNRLHNSKNPHHGTWCTMKARCSNKRVRSYKDYGAKGITVCDRWMHSLEAFIEDMGPRPEGMSIARIDKGGDYTPDNCVWEVSG